jgi:ABC-type sugar transport system permease subunit
VESGRDRRVAAQEVPGRVGPARSAGRHPAQDGDLARLGGLSVSLGSAQEVALRAPSPTRIAWRFRLWRSRHRQAILAFTILTPLLLYYTIFTWLPIAVVAAISFTEWNVIQWPPAFLGLENYVHILTDRYYHNVIRVTLTFSVVVIVLNMAIGLGIAILLNEQIRGRAIYRTIWYLPVVISGAVMAQTLVVFLYPAKFGVLNSLLGLAGLEPVIWTRSEFWMPFWVIAFSVWRGVGGVVIFFLAGLQSIDPALYEAAQVDGANRWRLFRHVTVPQLAPVTLFVFITQMVGSLQIWEAPLVLTFGGPNHATRTIVYSMYSDAFGNLTMGLAAAQAMLLMMVLMALSGVNLRLLRARD